MLLRKFEDNENFIVKRTAHTGQEADKLQSLASLIAPEQRQRLVHKFFDDDQTSFENLLLQLEAALSWSAAHRMLEQHFAERQINPYGDEAIRFSNLVYKRYFPKDELI
ncbi:MAG: hypothetical protein ALAOOOJD_00726 [bacterium]|nr:hypothetical protein [bacterium]